MYETHTDVGPGDALIVVDVQNDFLPGGALGVPDGDAVVAVLNRWIADFEAAGLPIFFTRDWHPANHCSFEARGGPWPPHCIASTPGAAFADDLEMPASAEVISKATTEDEEAYSGFQGTGLADRLSALGVKRVFVGGLATDYCVRATVLDARQSGLEAWVVEPAVRAVNVHLDDGERAMKEMKDAGARITDALEPSVSA
ncbi:MAG: nicotinamidase [Gammaproteobacteria bacterium]